MAGLLSFPKVEQGNEFREVNLVNETDSRQITLFGFPIKAKS
jgi:hypothetical protein